MHITRGSRAAIWQLGPRDLGSEGKRYAGFLVCLRIRGPHFVAMIRLPRNAGMAKRSPGARTFAERTLPRGECVGFRVLLL